MVSQVIPMHGNTPKSVCLTKSSAAEIVAHDWTKASLTAASKSLSKKAV